MDGMSVVVANRWRVGRKLGRTVYVQMGASPDDGDLLIGVMDTPELAAHSVAAHNAVLEIRAREGMVCDKYESCEHVACRSSYAAWAAADAALSPSPASTASDGGTG